jgi:hypothetical protein
MGSNGKGNVFKVINVASFDGLKGMIEGLQNFNIKLNEVNTMSNIS